MFGTSVVYPFDRRLLVSLVDFHPQVAAVIEESHLAGRSRTAERVEDQVAGAGVADNQVLCLCFGHEGGMFLGIPVLGGVHEADVVAPNIEPLSVETRRAGSLSFIYSSVAAAGVPAATSARSLVRSITQDVDVIGFPLVKTKQYLTTLG